MDVRDAQVVLVESLPFSNAEDSFRAASTSLTGRVGWIPDGEFGERIYWTAMLPEYVFPNEPDLDETLAPPVSSEPLPGELPGFWTFRIKAGHQLRFRDLHYGRTAVESFAVFRSLRDEGVIPADVRFQVCLPSPHSAADPVFDDPTQWPEIEAAYLDAMDARSTRSWLRRRPVSWFSSGIVRGSSSTSHWATSP